MPLEELPEIVLCIAPHPDDETLGCGMTLLRHIEEGSSVHWLIVTSMLHDFGFNESRILARDMEIRRVAETYGFAGVHNARFPTSRLDTLPLAEVIASISSVIERVRPNCIYLPYRNDAHSDHRLVFDAASACCKTFRYPSVRKIYAYETLSETDFGLRPGDSAFRPNLYIDGRKWLDRKLAVMEIYESELGRFPFPRSVECVRAQAMLRGSQAGVHAAEAFMVLKEIR